MQTAQTKFAPGCALELYNPGLSKKVHDYLNRHFGPVDLHTTCCRHDPSLSEPVRTIGTPTG